MSEEEAVARFEKAVDSGDEDSTLVRAHERGIPAFLVPARAARFRATIGSEKGREKIRARLPHNARDFDPRYATRLSSSLQVRDIEALLRAAGAPARCYVLSEDSDIDGRLLDLHDALCGLLFDDFGALVSCIPASSPCSRTKRLGVNGSCGEPQSAEAMHCHPGSHE